jgi:transposase-like protein
MYARGMTVRKIQGYLVEMYRTEASPEFISKVTDEVMAKVTAWQSRPLEPLYPWGASIISACCLTKECYRS